MKDKTKGKERGEQVTARMNELVKDRYGTAGEAKTGVGAAVRKV